MVWDSYFLGNLSKSLYGTATFSGIAFWDSYFEMSSEIPEAYFCSDRKPLFNLNKKLHFFPAEWLEIS